MRKLAITLLAIVVTTGAISVESAADDKSQKAAKKAAPEKVTWAQIKISGSYPDGPQSPSLFGPLTESLSDGIGRLDKAAGDNRITGVLLKISGPSLGRAKQSEFRQAIGRLRAKGKRVVAYMDSADTSGYLVATACDEIVMPEPAVLTVLGVRAEISFYKNLFDKLEIKPQMLRVGEFKSAAEPYSRTSMSEPFRREMNEILDDYYRQLVGNIAKSRKLDAKKVRAAIDSGPHTAAAAKKLGLIDRIAYADEVSKILSGGKNVTVSMIGDYGKKKIDNDFSGITGLVKMMNMLMGAESQGRASQRPKIAVIHATGMITTGSSSSSMFGGQTMGSSTIVNAVNKAAKDKTVKVIVLRVDSPGGSALASDLMWRALQKAGKPVVVSMGDVAASGGYYISMGADIIFAEPGTLTGSIGVVGGKVALRGLYNKVGITTTVLSRGKNAGALSMTDGFTDSERAAMQGMMNAIYKQFTTKAAKGRKMKYAKLEKLARGRVYTGAMAVKIGLVDKLGTLHDALAHARKIGGFKPGEKVEKLILPEPGSPFESLFGPMASARSEDAAVRSLYRSLQKTAPGVAGQLRKSMSESHFQPAASPPGMVGDFAARPASTAWEQITLADFSPHLVWGWFKPANAPQSVVFRVPEETFNTFPDRRFLSIRRILHSAGIDARTVAMWNYCGGVFDAMGGNSPLLDQPLPDPLPGVDPNITVYCRVMAPPVAAIPPAGPGAAVMPESAAAVPADDSIPSFKAGGALSDVFENIEVNWAAIVQIEKTLAGLRKQLSSMLARLGSLNRDLGPEERLHATRQDRSDWQTARRWLRDVSKRVSQCLKTYDIGDHNDADRRVWFEQTYEQSVISRKKFEGIDLAQREYESHRKTLQTLMMTMNTALQTATQDGERRAQQILGKIARSVRAAQSKR
eukprot:g26722.t1